MTVSQAYYVTSLSRICNIDFCIEFLKVLFIIFPAAVVGLEETLYHVSEDVGVVEVCAIVYSPNIACPIAFPFNVTLTTANDTASECVGD